MGIKMNITKSVKVVATTVRVFVKVCDQGCYTVKDQHNDEICRQVGRTPSYFPEATAYRDYLALTIDIETGKILNWKKPSSEDIESLINK